MIEVLAASLHPPDFAKLLVWIEDGFPHDENPWTALKFVFATAERKFRMKHHTFEIIAVDFGPTLESESVIAQALGHRRVVTDRTPAFRNRWEEDRFFNRPCQEVAPQAPDGVNIDLNIREAQRKVAEIVDRAMQVARAGGVMDINIEIGVWFAGKVRSGDDWDYKRKNGSEYQDFGNFNYGAVGAAIGYSAGVLLRAAGAYQMYEDWQNRGRRAAIGQGVFWGSPPHGDDAADQNIIRQGTDYGYERVYRQCPYGWR